MPNRGKLDNAISNFNGALLQADVTKTVSTNEVARMLRYVAMGLIDLAEALEQ